MARAALTLIALTCALFAYAQDGGRMLDAAAGSAPRLPGAIGTSGPDFLPVEEAYQPLIEPRPDQIRVRWRIADGYYLYQHRLEFALSDARGPIELDSTLPPALEREDEYFGEVRVYYGEADITLVPARTPEATAELTLRSQGCADAGLCYPPRTDRVRIDFQSGVVTPIAAREQRGSAAATTPAATTGPPTAPAGLALTLLLAFAGGVILNFMPCVFPILSLKILGLATTAPTARRRQSLAYLGGVVLSFLLVAAVLVLLQQSGRAVGWGFQLQSPAFVVALAYLFLAMGLSLAGLVTLGEGWMGLGDQLTRQGGARGSFFTGMLAVVVASPCTAPFMGTAIGFALTRPALEGGLVFAALGLGMATPMVLLAELPAARRWLPRPGPWMETLRQAFAFPLLATAVWLCWVAGQQTGVNGMAVALAGALLVALALWLWRFGRLARAGAAVALIAGLAVGTSGTSAGRAQTALPEGTEAWSEARLASLRRAGTPVFVDVTADWCITCLANEEAVLFTDTVQRAFRENGVVYLVADWTSYSEDIGAFVKRHGRSGIPLYLLYPAGQPQAVPQRLPQVLTRSAVLRALEAAGRAG